MKEFLFDYYLWIKAFHLIAVIAWMAGIFYLPRLFVYHVGKKPLSETAKTFETMEYKLLKIIMNPAMIVAWALGLVLLWLNNDLLSQPWMHIKLTAVVLMTIFHHFLAREVKAFSKNKQKYSEKTYRLMNEIPTVLMVVIVIMVIVKPVI